MNCQNPTAPAPLRAVGRNALSIIPIVAILLALLSELPTLETRQRAYHPIQGELPSPLNPPAGCSFHPRCPQAMARCRTETPVLRMLAPGHASACHLNDVPSGLTADAKEQVQ